MKLFAVEFDEEIKVYKTMKLAQRAVELYSLKNKDGYDYVEPEIEEFDVDIPKSKREIYVCKMQFEYGPGYSTGEIRNNCDNYESNSYYYLFNHKSDAYKKCYDDAYDDIKRYFDSYIVDYMYCDCDNWDVEYIKSKNLYKIYEFNDKDGSRKLINEFKGPKYGKYFSGNIGMGADDCSIYAVSGRAFDWRLNKGNSSLTSMSRIYYAPHSLPYSIENRTYDVFKVKIKGRV